MLQVHFAIVTDATGAYDSDADARRPSEADVPRLLLGPLALYAVEWIDGTLADGVGAVLSVTDTLGGVDKSLLTLTNANDDKLYYPRVPACDAAGADLAGLYTLPLVDGMLKLVVAAGGNTKAGGCIVYLAAPDA